MAKYNIGEEVRLVYSIKNDGTYRGFHRGDILAEAGESGFVKESGPFLDGWVYQVHFLPRDLIIGCREHEIISAETPWKLNRFNKGDAVKARYTLQHEQTKICESGTVGTVQAVRYMEGMEYIYEVAFKGSDSQLCLLKETQLEP